MRNTILTALLFLLILLTGYILLAYSLDISYDPNTEQAAGSSSEAEKHGTLVKRLIPQKAIFHTSTQSGEQGTIEDIWTEKGWHYNPHGLLDRICGMHPTALTGNTVLVVRFSGKSAFDYGGIGNWEFSLDSTAAGGTFGKGYQMMPLRANITAPTKLYVVRAPLDQSKPTVIVDNIKLR